MAESDLKTNSLKLRFESDSKEPMEPEIFEFMRVKMKLKADNLLSMYKDRLEAAVIIKFRTEQEYKSTLARLPSTMEFAYDKYQSTKVHLSPASAVVKYVRLFNLPPEVEDGEIGPVLAKFGKVQRLVREKYGEETGFPIWTSVRGAYMELKEGTEIPATIHVRNLRARVFYEGLVNKCFTCNATDHVKADCPNRKTVNSRIEAARGTSYSSALSSGVARWTKQKMAPTTLIPDPVSNMTNLNTLLKRVVHTAKSDVVLKKRPLSHSSHSSNDEEERASSMETDGVEKEAEDGAENRAEDEAGPSGVQKQQQQKQQKKQQSKPDGDGDGWQLVRERKGKKVMPDEPIVRSSSVGAQGSEPFRRPERPRKQTISGTQRERTRSRSAQKKMKIDGNVQPNVAKKMDGADKMQAADDDEKKVGGSGGAEGDEFDGDSL